MPRAVWNGTVVAESTDFEEVEGNVYFPHNALKREFFRDSAHTSVCPWKGRASYFDLIADGREDRAAAWTYPDPKPAAQQIKDYVAFGRGVRVHRNSATERGPWKRIRALVRLSNAR